MYYFFILDFIYGFSGLSEDNCKMRQETSKFGIWWDLYQIFDGMSNFEINRPRDAEREMSYDGFQTWNKFPRYRLFLREIHRWPPPWIPITKGQQRGALMCCRWLETPWRSRYVTVIELQIFVNSKSNQHQPESFVAWTPYAQPSESQWAMYPANVYHYYNATIQPKRVSVIITSSSDV